MFYNAVVSYESLTTLSVCSLKQQPALIAINIVDYTLIDTQDKMLVTRWENEKTHVGSSGISVTSQAASNCMRFGAA